MYSPVAISLTVKEGKITIPGSQFGWEEGKELIAVETEDGTVWIGDKSALGSWSLEQLTAGLQKSGASYEDAIAEANKGMEAKFDELINKKE